MKRFILALFTLMYVGCVPVLGQDASIEARLENVGPTTGQARENPKDGQKYVWIPPGTFMMGCSASDTDCVEWEKPQHQVSITRSFWIGQTPVTVGAYKRYAGATGRQMPPDPYFKNENMPIVNVSWDDAQAYCGWMGGRLPTEAEWEYAGRGGSTEARYGKLDDIAWYSQNSGDQMHEVAQKRPNGFGLYDMLGNVYEWVNDWYDQIYYQNSPSQDPAGPASGQERVLRGGSGGNNPGEVRVSGRGGINPANRSPVIGFRCGGEVFAPYGHVLGQDRAPIENQQSVKKPLNQAQIFALLAGGVQSHRVAILVQERGIDFEPTADYFQMVRQTGGDDELVDVLKSAKVTPSRITTTDQTGPSLEATFDFMGRMVAPEKRFFLLGGLDGLPTQAGACPAFMVSNQTVIWADSTRTTHVHGYPQRVWDLDYTTPGYMRLDLGGIDPSSIQSAKTCCDGEALAEFMNQHPESDKNPEYRALESQFINSGEHDITIVVFKTVDLKPTIEFGDFETQPTCQDKEKHGTECVLKPLPKKTGSMQLVFFRDKERAERFVTALTHAVMLCGGTPSMFPPTPSQK